MSPEKRIWPQKRVVAQKFSSSRKTYESSSSFHDKLARKLIEVQPKNIGVGPILEIGSHTGTTTKMLGEKFPNASIMTLDLQFEGTGLAPHVQADGEALPMMPETFEMIVSGSTFQWFSDLEKSLKDIMECLRPGGLLGFSQFLKPSFEPLSSFMQEVAGGNRFLPLLNYEELEALLLRIGGLKHFSRLEEVHYFENFKSLHKYVREMGVGAPAVGQSALKKSDIRELKLKLCRNTEKEGLPLQFSGALVWLEKADF